MLAADILHSQSILPPHPGPQIHLPCAHCNSRCFRYAAQTTHSCNYAAALRHASAGFAGRCSKYNTVSGMQDGLWGVVQELLGRKVDIPDLREKYKKVERVIVREEAEQHTF